jgi:hypothetical protein
LFKKAQKESAILILTALWKLSRFAVLMILMLPTIASESMLADARKILHPILIAPEIIRIIIPTKQSSSNKEMIVIEREFVLLIPTVTAKHSQEISVQILQKSKAVLRKPENNALKDAMLLVDATDWIANMLEENVAMNKAKLHADWNSQPQNNPD